MIPNVVNPNGLSAWGAVGQDYFQQTPFGQFVNWVGSNPLAAQVNNMPRVLYGANAGAQMAPMFPTPMGPNPYAGMPNPHQTGLPSLQQVAPDPYSGMPNPRPNNTTSPQPNTRTGTGSTTQPAAGPTGQGANPNEPGAMPNQYNQQALKDQPTQNLGIGGKTVGQGAGNGAGAGTGYRTWVDPQGNKRSSDPKIDYAYMNIDAKANMRGFTDQFMQLHGMDPITFYARAFANDQNAKGYELPGPQGDAARSWLFFKAANAAENDARFLPGAVDEWRRVHGGQDIPQEQWERWWSISQRTGGYPDYSGGPGINPYGVY